MEVVKLYIIFMAVAFKYSLATLSEMEQPSVACPDLFKYVTDANEAYGIITIPTQDITDKRVHLTVTVNQRDTKNLIYNLLPVESIDNSIRKLYENKPIEFRLIFASPTEYPKITKITVNENTVCSDVGYPAPSITTVLQLILGSLISSSRDLSLQKLHNCFNYFRYEEQNNKTIGKIKIPHYLFHDGKFEVSVSVSQKPPIQYNVFGLSPYKTLDETILDHLEGKPSYYRFDFPGQTEIPLLKYIKVNGKIICTTNNGNVRSNRIWYSATHSQHFTGGFGNLNTDDEDDDDDSEESKDKRTCGRENDVLIPIVRFNDTTGQFPWLAAIYLKRNDTLKFICSGSLISARTVISAAYCFDTESVMADQMIVKLGGGIKATDSQIFNFGVEKIIIHPNYTSALIADANIALLHLTSSVIFSNYINPICLWNESTELHKIVNKLAYILSWNSTESDSIANTTQKVGFARIVNNIECLSSSDKFKTITSPRTFCASNAVIPGPCTGDFGSGIMMRKNKHWSLRGIVSDGPRLDGECYLNEFVVFCDLAKHLDWLNANIVF